MLGTGPSLPGDAVLLRLPATDQGWPLALPPVPAGLEVTVTVGHPDLLPTDIEDARARGYRIVGAASDQRPIGSKVDVLVTGAQRAAAPAWWTELLARSERAFDLRLGPVQLVLRSELDLHARALSA